MTLRNFLEFRASAMLIRLGLKKSSSFCLFTSNSFTSKSCNTYILWNEKHTIKIMYMYTYKQTKALVVKGIHCPTLALLLKVPAVTAYLLNNLKLLMGDSVPLPCLDRCVTIHTYPTCLYYFFYTYVFRASL